MRKQLEYLGMTSKTADQRNMEAKQEIQKLKALLEEVTTVSDYLRNNMDDVLLPNQLHTLFELTRDLGKFKKVLQ